MVCFIDILYPGWYLNVMDLIAMVAETTMITRMSLFRDAVSISAAHTLCVCCACVCVCSECACDRRPSQEVISSSLLHGSDATVRGTMDTEVFILETGNCVIKLNNKEQVRAVYKSDC